MARKLRSIVPGLLHHVTERGNNQQDVFRSERDRIDYLKMIRIWSESCSVDIFGYCLMSNHVHLVVRPHDRESLPTFMRRLQSEYAVHFNARWGRSGHLWRNRYYSCTLEGRHGLNALRYVDRNPVAAGLIERASEWPWSSAAAHCAGQQDAFGLLRMEWREWWDWPTEWGQFIATGNERDDELIRRHTRVGRMLAAPKDEVSIKGSDPLGGEAAASAALQF